MCVCHCQYVSVWVWVCLSACVYIHRCLCVYASMYPGSCAMCISSVSFTQPSTDETPHSLFLIHISFHPALRLCIHSSIQLSVHPSNHPFNSKIWIIHLAIHPSIHPGIHLPIHHLVITGNWFLWKIICSKVEVRREMTKLGQGMTGQCAPC